MTFPAADARVRPARPRPAGTVAAFVLLGLLGLGTIGISAAGVSLGAIGGACLDGGCTMVRVELGWIAATVLPWLAFASAVAATVVLVAQRREAWWVPLAAGPAVIIAFGFGWMLWSSGLPL